MTNFKKTDIDPVVYDATSKAEIDEREASAREILHDTVMNNEIEVYAAQRATDYGRMIAAHELSCMADKIAVCESPIEARLLIAMRFMTCPIFFKENYDDRPVILSQFAFSQDNFLARYPLEGTGIFPQAQVGKYRADFLVVSKFACSPTVHHVVVECDGHDFHEKTKEQAARDKARDRDMATLGCHVLRFTGSEIYRDADRCAAQVSEFLHELELRERTKAGK